MEGRSASFRLGKANRCMLSEDGFGLFSSVRCIQLGGFVLGKERGREKIENVEKKKILNGCRKGLSAQSV